MRRFLLPMGLISTLAIGGCSFGFTQDHINRDLAQRAESDAETLAQVIQASNEEVFLLIDKEKAPVYEVDSRRNSAIDHALTSRNKVIRYWAEERLQDSNSRAEDLFDLVQNGMTVADFQRSLQDHPFYLNAVSRKAGPRPMEEARYKETLFRSLIATGHGEHAYHLFNAGADPFVLHEAWYEYAEHYLRSDVVCGSHPKLVWNLIDFDEKRGGRIMAGHKDDLLVRAARCRGERQSSAEIIDGLIERGASPQVKVGAFDTPLVEDVAKFHSGEALAALLDHLDSSVLEAESEDLGSTLLFRAVEAQNLETVKVLLERGSEVNHRRPSDGAAPIGTAINAHGRFTADLPVPEKERLVIALLNELLEYGADINHANDMGYTPLMSAAIHGFENVATFVIDHGGNPDMTNAEGDTAADLAKQYGHDHLLDLL